MYTTMTKILSIDFLMAMLLFNEGKKLNNTNNFNIRMQHMIQNGAYTRHRLPGIK